MPKKRTISLPKTSPLAGMPGGKRRLLLIEPNPSHQEILSDVIYNYPMRDQLDYFRTCSREDAIRALKKEMYDLILSADLVDDAASPWLNTLRALQPDTPIVMLTSSSDTQKVGDYVRSGASEVVLKSQESLKLLPELFTRYLHHRNAKKPKRQTQGLPEVELPSDKSNVKKILERLNRLSALGDNFPELPAPLQAIRSDIVNLTKMVKDLL